MKSRGAAIFLKCLFSFLFSACTTSNDGKLLHIEGIQEQLKSVEDRTVDLDVRMSILESQYAMAYLDPAEKSFGRIDTDLGTFLVSIKRVSKYVDGYKVVLEIGNPNYATYPNPKLKVSWGPRYDRSLSFQERKNRTRQKEVTVHQRLQAGSWNSVELVLAPANEADIGEIGVSISAASIGLFTK